jgi:uncharacterized protein YndB with AHSA1/START domain
MMSLTFETYVRAMPERVWEALTDPAIVPLWRFGLSFQTDWQKGSKLTSDSPKGRGFVKESVRRKRLVYDWIQVDQPQANGGHSSTVSFDIFGMGEATRLSVVHSDLEPDGAFIAVVASGWPMILSSLKSLLETGQPLSFAKTV